MKRKDFFKNICMVGIASTIPINLLANQPHVLFETFCGGPNILSCLVEQNKTIKMYHYDYEFNEITKEDSIDRIQRFEIIYGEVIIFSCTHYCDEPIFDMNFVRKTFAKSKSWIEGTYKIKL